MPDSLDADALFQGTLPNLPVAEGECILGGARLVARVCL
jgi:hypothetical protein